MQMWPSMRITLALASAALLVACSGRSGAEDAVRKILKDPESARFGDFYFNSKTGKGCLTVNAKNSMGGYTGDQQAYVRRGEDGWESHYISEVGPDICRRNADTPD